MILELMKGILRETDSGSGLSNSQNSTVIELASSGVSFLSLMYVGRSQSHSNKMLLGFLLYRVEMGLDLGGLTTAVCCSWLRMGNCAHLFPMAQSTRLH